MKNTLHFFLTIIFFMSVASSYAEKKSNDTYVCPTANISYANASICTSDSNIQPVILTGTDNYLGGVFSSTSGIVINSVTGAINPSTSATGTYVITYTIPAGPGCPSTTVTTSVEIIEQAYAGADGGLAVCNIGSPINLYNLITGEQSGGTWIRTSGGGGGFDAVGGIFMPDSGTTTSTFIYTLTGSVPCTNDSSIATVIINPLPTATISGSTTICIGSSANLTITGTPNTVVTLTDGGVPMNVVLDGSGNITITVSPTVTTTYNLTSASLNGCSIPLTQSATVTVSATPQFITQIPDITICNGGMLNIASQLTSTIPGTTFIWSATTGNVNTSFISGDHTNIDQIINLINTSQTGIISILIAPKKGNCTGALQEILVTVSPIPTIALAVANTNVICNNQSVTITANSYSSATAYNWQVNSTTNVQIVGGATSGTSTTGIINLQLALVNPLVSGTISFNITPANGICTGATMTNAVTININPIPSSPIPLPINEICSGEILNLNISSSLNIIGTTLEWTVTDSQNVSGFTNGTGLSPIAINDALINTSNNQGYVKYSVTSKLGNCVGGTTDYIIYVNPLPNPVLTDGNICVNTTTGVPYQSYILDTQLSDPTLVYDWFLLNTTTNTYDQIVGASASTYEAIVAGSYQVSVTNTITNCIDQASADVIEIFPATGMSTTVSNSTITIDVNPIGTGNLIYTLDNGASQVSNVFTGIEPGIHTVLVSDIEGCTNLSAEVSINEEFTDLVLYPNPSFDTLNFSNKNKVMSVQISNQLGQVVLTKDIQLKNGSIDLSELNMGIYNVVFETESGTVSQKVVKQ